MLVCYLEHSLTYCLPAINHDDCGPNHMFQKAVKIGIRFFFCSYPCGSIQLFLLLLKCFIIIFILLKLFLTTIQ